MTQVVCQTCGDCGFPEILNYCVKCRETAVHTYCLEKLPKDLNADISWTCEDCISETSVNSSLHNLSAVLVLRGQSMDIYRQKTLYPRRKKMKWSIIYAAKVRIERKYIKLNRIMASSKKYSKWSKVLAKTSKGPKEVSVTSTPDTMGLAFPSATLRPSSPPDKQGTTSGTLSTNVPQRASKGSLDAEGTNSFISKSFNTSVLDLVSNFNEVNSDGVFNISQVKVGPYLMNPKLAPILEDIIEKYGDISENCIFENVFIRSRMLEVLCKAIKKLKHLHFRDLTPYNLDYLLSAVNAAEQVNLKVGWLRCRHKELFEAVSSLRQYKNIRDVLKKRVEVRKSTEKTLDKKEEDLRKLQSEFHALKRQLSSLTAEIQDMETPLNTVKSKCKTFYNKYLMDGLI